jgi:hypothetical protein
MNPQFRFTVGEVDLMVEALELRARRHEAMARFNPRNAGPHDRKAEAMRKLRHRLIIGDFETEVQNG